MNTNGCVWVMPTLLAVGLVCVAYVARLCWRKGLQQRPNLDAQ